MNNFAAIVFTASPDSSGSASGFTVKIDGREALLRSLELFVNRDNVTSIITTFSPDSDADSREKFGTHLMVLGIKAATGGPGFRDQLTAAREQLPTEITHVIVHDAARPAVSFVDLEKMLELVEQHDAIALATRIDGRVATLDETGRIESLAGSGSVRRLVFPMVFTKKMFDELVAKGFDSILSRLFLLESSTFNVRANNASDAGVLKSMLALLPKPKPKASTNPFDEAQW